MSLDTASRPDLSPPHAGEWTFTGDMEDEGVFTGACDACDKGGLRVRFVIRHGGSGQTRRICTNCLCRKPVSVEVDGATLDAGQRRNLVKELLARTQSRTCRDTIRQVLQLTADPALPEISAYFDRNLQLSPRRAAKLFPLLKRLRRRVDPSIFEVQMRGLGHKEEFADLEETEKRTVWPALSATVKHRLAGLGLDPDGRAG
jgi:hypothetical protein